MPQAQLNDALVQLAASALAFRCKGWAVTEVWASLHPALALAKSLKHHADLLIMGHTSACNSHTWAAEFTRSVHHFNRVVDLYDPEKHFHLADSLNTDPKTVAGLFGSIGTWMLGYPDRALRLSVETEERARRRGTP